MAERLWLFLNTPLTVCDELSKTNVVHWVLTDFLWLFLNTPLTVCDELSKTNEAARAVPSNVCAVGWSVSHWIFYAQSTSTVMSGRWRVRASKKQ